MSCGAPVPTENNFQSWKLIRDFRARVEQCAAGRPQHRSWEDHRRVLNQFDYLSTFLFALVNPALKTMRALSAASRSQRMQEEVCTNGFSMGSFSEAQHLVEPQLLEMVFLSLADEFKGPMPTDPREAWQEWFAQDSSIFPALSRMMWAEYGGGNPAKSGKPNNAVRLHVSFNLLDDKPAKVEITPGKVCERKVWRQMIKPNTLTVGDRYFGTDFAMFTRLHEQGCRFVLRLRDEVIVDPQEDNPLDVRAQQAGILSDTWACLGSQRNRTGPWRIITIQKSDGGVMRLVTNIPPREMSARDIQVIYRRRWQIECFFRWVKCLLGCRHWLAESPKGVAIQLYLAVIAGLLLQLVIGRRPNKRVMERLQMFLLGWATLEELMSEVAKSNALAVKKS